MNILFYRYGSICEPDVIATFKKMEMDVYEITEEVAQKNIPASKQVELVKNGIENNMPAFVFSINFIPAIAEVCRIYGVLYLCWTVDSPVLELFSKTAAYGTNRIFMFDRAQFEYFQRFCPGVSFYMPLASSVERFDRVTAGGKKGEKYSFLDGFRGDISFVGSLYSEKNPLKNIPLSEHTKGYIDGITQAALNVYGFNFIEESLNEECVDEIRKNANNFFSAKDSLAEKGEMDRYVAANAYVGYHASEQERIRTLNLLAKHFNVDLFTRSDAAPLENVMVHDGIKTLTEMPIVFHQSKINLNMTIKPIQTGLPLRIFDILGCGGFLMTNYQQELPEMFEIGEDLEAYGSMDELVEKCAYYLEHEDERRRIAQNGYQKVKQFHTYEARIAQMLKIIYS